jgi:hypothetical protein
MRWIGILARAGTLLACSCGESDDVNNSFGGSSPATVTAATATAEGTAEGSTGGGSSSGAPSPGATGEVATGGTADESGSSSAGSTSAGSTTTATTDGTTGAAGCDQFCNGCACPSDECTMCCAQKGMVDVCGGGMCGCF